MELSSESWSAAQRSTNASDVPIASVPVVAVVFTLPFTLLFALAPAARLLGTHVVNSRLFGREELDFGEGEALHARGQPLFEGLGKLALSDDELEAPKGGAAGDELLEPLLRRVAEPSRVP